MPDFSLRKYLSTFLLAGCLFAPSAAISQQGEEPPSVSVTEVTSGIYLLRGRGGNVLASVGEDGILLVDSDYASYRHAYEKALDGLASKGLKPRFLVNTHWHGDHTSNNDFWADKGAVIVAHHNVRKRMAAPNSRGEGETAPRNALPVVTYGDSLTLHFNGDDVEVQHLPPGHTDGDSIVFFSQANVVHMGDQMFLDAFPYVDMNSGGGLIGYTANVAAALERMDARTIVVPGHGARLANKNDVQRYHDMLIETATQVNAALDQGMDVEAIIAKGLGEKWTSWGQGFIDERRWVSTIAASHPAQ